MKLDLVQKSTPLNPNRSCSFPRSNQIGRNTDDVQPSHHLQLKYPHSETKKKNALKIRFNKFF